MEKIEPVSILIGIVITIIGYGIYQIIRTETNTTYDEYYWFYPLVLGAFLVIIGIVIGGWLFGSDNPVSDGNMLSYATNLWTELISIGITIAIIERFSKYRENESREIRDNEQKELDRKILRVGKISQLRLASSDIEKIVLMREMRDLQLLTNGDFAGINLSGLSLTDNDFRNSRLTKANFTQADLTGSIFKGANLSHSLLKFSNLSLTNFEDANLHKANLFDATLDETNLSNAKIDYSDFQRAKAFKANFTNANLSNADFQFSQMLGVNFTNANLSNVNFQGSDWFSPFYDSYGVELQTILPDGSDYDVSKSIKQLERFTNPKHPDFWQPNWVKDISEI